MYVQSLRDEHLLQLIAGARDLREHIGIWFTKAPDVVELIEKPTITRQAVTTMPPARFDSTRRIAPGV